VNVVAGHPGERDPLARAGTATWWLIPLLFGYLVFIRTHNISEQFWMLGDQIRDWRVALRPMGELPLHGVPSLSGGTTLGPIFYWVLWLIRVTVGPFADNLPHAGGIGLSILHSGADAFLFYALARRLGSIPLSLAIVLLSATAPYDMALTATIWNPVLATTLSKVTIGTILLSRDWSVPRAVAVVAMGWLALQAHISGLFVGLAAMAWAVLQPLFDRRPGRTLAAVAAAAAVVVILQVPYVWANLDRTGPPRRDRIRESIVYSLQNPGQLRPIESARAVATALNTLVWAPSSLPRFGALLTAGAVLALVFFRRQGPVIAVSIAPLLIAIGVFAVWRGRLTELYWYLSLVVCATMSLVIWIARVHPLMIRTALALLALIAVALLQPARFELAWRTHRWPEYGILVRGSRQIARQAPEVRAIVAPFLPRTSDPAFVYEILGGRIARDAALVAVIDRNGMVSYRKQ
jgi:hypothetical protein